MLMVSSDQAKACPDYSLQPSFGLIELNEGFPNDPFTRRITAGGTYGLAWCFDNPNLTGSVASKPDFDLYYHTSGYTPLTIFVDSPYDTMLLVNTPSGDWLFDDDSGGNGNPMIVIPNAADGLYDIWIGSYDGARGLPGTLYITER